MTTALFLLSVAPLGLFLILLLTKKTLLLQAALITLGLVLGLSLVLWRILPSYLLLSTIKGFLVAFDIFIIIFGAIFFLQILEETGVMSNIGGFLESFSRDYRLQVILLAWFLENFLEGTAGFGTPSTVVAPLLVGLGLKPLPAVIIALLGNSASVVFGAAGTPIRTGFAGLDIAGIPEKAALFNLVGLLVPAFMLWTLTRGRKESRREFFEALPFALWAGVAFVVPSLLTVGLGQEFPSIIGAVAGLLLVLLTTRLGIFVPKVVRRLEDEKVIQRTLSFGRTFFPYLLLIVLLFLGKFLLGNLAFSLGPKYSISLFNPGLAFILAGLPVAFFWGRRNLVFSGAKTAFLRAVEPFLVILSMSVLVQLMINSGQNRSTFPSMLHFLAQSIETPFLPFSSPFIGAFGSFLTGSATISNLMFGNFLHLASEELSLNTSGILSLALVGAAAGNMIALADILAAEAVVGLRHEERNVLKGVIVPCLIYVLLVALIGGFFGRI